MLVLQRKRGEEILIDGCIRVKILSTKGNSVRIGIEAPDDVSILRGELDACQLDAAGTSTTVEVEIAAADLSDLGIMASIAEAAISS